jgi:hypothetical protein
MLLSNLLQWPLIQFASWFQTFVFSDWNFTGYLMVAVMLDTATGIRASLMLHNHASFPLRALGNKLWQYAGGLVVGHLITQHLIAGQPNPVMELVGPFFKGGLYLLMLWAEILSADENLKRAGGPGFLPRFIARRMAAFEETGRIEEPANEPDPPQTPLQ